MTDPFAQIAQTFLLALASGVLLILLTLAIILAWAYQSGLVQ